MEVNIHEAKTHLSKLLQRVAVGEEIIIARAGVPVARLVPVQAARRPRPLGMDRGLFEVPEDFDAPLPPQILAAFSGDQSEKARPKRKRRREHK
jgi:prevent-host-death family protein